MSGPPWWGLPPQIRLYPRHGARKDCPIRGWVLSQPSRYLCSCPMLLNSSGLHTSLLDKQPYLMISEGVRAARGSGRRLDTSVPDLATSVKIRPSKPTGPASVLSFSGSLVLSLSSLNKPPFTLSSILSGYSSIL